MIRSKTKYNNLKKNFFEKDAWEKNLYVCGIDEVGRGCLAGPLVVAAVILPINSTIPRIIKDSKILTKEERETAYEWIIRNCGYSTSIASWKEIDKFNIYQATLRIMSLTILKLMGKMPFDKTKLKYFLIDAMPLRIPEYIQHENLECHNFNFGETYSSSIAAASIIAKVTRDRLMEKFGEVFPFFEFEKHKGYGTEVHKNVIKEKGLSIIHRQSFVKNFKEEESAVQDSIFNCGEVENEFGKERAEPEN